METASFVQNVVHFECKERLNQMIVGEVDMSMSRADFEEEENEQLQEENDHLSFQQTEDEDDSIGDQHDAHNRTAITSFIMEDDEGESEQ